MACVGVVSRFLCLGFLGFWDYNFGQIWNIFAHFFFTYFFRISFFLLPFGDPSCLYVRPLEVSQVVNVVLTLYECFPLCVSLDNFCFCVFRLSDLLLILPSVFSSQRCGFVFRSSMEVSPSSF